MIIVGRSSSSASTEPTSPDRILDYEFLIDRTIMGVCFLDVTYQISYYFHATYLTYFLQMVYETDVATAGYISNTFSVVSSAFLIISGWLVRATSRFNWVSWVSVPLYMLELGLLIRFRQRGVYIGYIAMCGIFFSWLQCFILCVRHAVQAAVGINMLPRFYGCCSLGAV